jgi:hypothetical protein
MDAQFQTPQVYAECAQRKWIALHGASKSADWRHQDGVRRFFSPKQIHRAATGLCPYHFFAPDRIKDVLAQIREDRERFQIPTDAPERYIDSMSGSEIRMMKPNAKGFMMWTWEKARANNHLWDCEVMQIVAAMIYGLVRGDANAPKGSQIEKPSGGEAAHEVVVASQIARPKSKKRQTRVNRSTW